jgi:hypothetical protein
MERHGLVKSNVAVIDEGAEEAEVTGAAKSLPQLEDSLVERLVLDVFKVGHAAFFSFGGAEHKLMNQDNLIFGFISNHHVPRLFLKEGVRAGELFFG